VILRIPVFTVRHTLHLRIPSPFSARNKDGIHFEEKVDSAKHFNIRYLSLARYHIRHIRFRYSTSSDIGQVDICDYQN